MNQEPNLGALKRVIDEWDPASGELPDEVALAMDAHPELQAHFDARFSRWEAPDDDLAEHTGTLADRVLDAPPPTPRPANRRWWLAALPVGGLGAAALVSVALISVLSVGRNLEATFQEVPVSFDAVPPVGARPDAVVTSPPVDAKPGDLVARNKGVELGTLGYVDTPTQPIGGERVDGNLPDRFATLSIDATVAVDPRVPVADPTAGNTFVDHGVNGFVETARDPLSTFSIDVDGASYTQARRQLRDGFLPNPASIRVEEFVNRLDPDLAPPESGPLTVQFEAGPSPWAPGRDYVRIGMKAREPAVRAPAHLTFLIDTSGSMSTRDKLPLVRQAMELLVSQLGDGDTVAIVTYAGSAGLALPPTPATERTKILGAFDRLQAGGSTAMGQGIDLAYRLAEETAKPGHVNRVILASDGDANVGRSDPASMLTLLRGAADRGITLTTLGFGNGNYRDATMERLADDGDGNYFYVDGIDEARRVFVDELTSTLEVVARDVKLQVEWNPETVRRYRLIGYENRAIADQDFRDDAVDAGEIGAGHQVTALYEVERIPGAQGDLATVRTRAEPPGGQGVAVERSFSLPAGAVAPSSDATSAAHRMTIASATFAERLRGSPYVTGVSYRAVAELAERSVRPDHPDDTELLSLIVAASRLSGD